MRKLGAVLAAACFIGAGTLAASPTFAAKPQKLSITYTVKGKTICTMTLLDDSGVLLGGSTCGGNTVGFVLESNGKPDALVLSTTQGAGSTATALQFFVELSNNEFVAGLFNGKSADVITGTVKITG